MRPGYVFSDGEVCGGNLGLQVASHPDRIRGGHYRASHSQTLPLSAMDKYDRPSASACTCTTHARASDFEHAIPYDQGGKTCACNGGARSRRCHHVKQSDGWSVTQPRPGWHQWTTPSGRTYIQGPMRYPI